MQQFLQEECNVRVAYSTLQGYVKRRFYDTEIKLANKESKTISLFNAEEFSENNKKQNWRKTVGSSARQRVK